MQSPSLVARAFRHWMMPLTWAATAGLCVVLVMNIPDTDSDISPSESIEEAFAAPEANVVHEEAEKLASVRDGQDQPAPLARTRQEFALEKKESADDFSVRR